MREKAVKGSLYAVFLNKPLLIFIYMAEYESARDPGQISVTHCSADTYINKIAWDSAWDTWDSLIIRLI